MKLTSLFRAGSLGRLWHTLNLVINFDGDWYKRANPDVAAWGGNPLKHFLRHGIDEGRSPSEWFSLTAFSKNRDLDRPHLAMNLGQSVHSKEDLNNLVLNFDAHWYLRTNADVAEWGGDPLRHFLEHGADEGRSPSEWFSLPVFNRHRGLYPMGPAVPGHDDAPKDNEYRRLHAERAQAYAGCENLLIFFNVARDLIGGGMLSINRFVGLAMEIADHDASTMVAMSGVPLENRIPDYSLFVPTAPSVDFEQIRKVASPRRVSLFVPEVFAVTFLEALSREDRGWLAERESVRIVVLNQNNDLMPPASKLQPLTWPITKDVTISTAHSRYCTQQLATRYGMAVKQLTPLLPEMPDRPFRERKKIFMLSPDPLRSSSDGLTREGIVATLKAALPDFAFVTVENMALAEYLDLAAHAMFSLTFGEGLDGYFIEPILSGGVAFSRYNDTFFPQSFKTTPTLRPSWESLTRFITEQAPRLAADADAYDRMAAELRGILDTHFSRAISRGQLAGLLAGEVDFRPQPVSQPVREHARPAERHRFSSFPLENRMNVTQTPDGLLIEHCGDDLYPVLKEIYQLRRHNLRLRDGQDYVLLDIGANVGASSLYLSHKYPRIREIFAYEPIPATAAIAARNFRRIRRTTKVSLRTIGLSDRFDMRAMLYIPDRSTAFSTENMILHRAIMDGEGDLVLPARAVEVETVPADAEFGAIASNLNGRRLAIKCDSVGSEARIFPRLAAAGILDLADAVIVESYFSEPDALAGLLTSQGFRCKVHLDSAKYKKHTIRAFRSGAHGAN